MGLALYGALQSASPALGEPLLLTEVNWDFGMYT